MCPSSSVDNPSVNIGIGFYIKKNNFNKFIGNLITEFLDRSSLIYIKEKNEKNSID